MTPFFHYFPIQQQETIQISIEFACSNSQTTFTHPKKCWFMFFKPKSNAVEKAIYNYWTGLKKVWASNN
jgi:hypothetical protein